MQQLSDEWFAARLGCVTASRISDVVAKTRTGWGASRKNYLSQLVVERLTGAAVESYCSPAMERGIELESDARSAYEFFEGIDVKEVGFIVHPEISKSGASPDGLVGDDGLVEFKCPNMATHLGYLAGGSIDKKYLLQIQWQMACTGRKWCDFVSYDPRFPSQMQLFVKRVSRDDDEIKELAEAVEVFLKELDDRLKELKRLYPKQELPILMAG